MANNTDPDQLASQKPISGSILFAKAGSAGQGLIIATQLAYTSRIRMTFIL